MENTNPSLLILYLGADWWGSDARALAMEFRAAGHTLIELNYEDYFPLKWSTLPLKFLRRAFRHSCAVNYNEDVIANGDNRAIDFVLAFKGMLLEPETVRFFNSIQIPVYCFYPDVGFAAYGNNIAKCLPLYDCFFTTKAFHASDPTLSRHLHKIEVVSHGFDPEVHRPVKLSRAASLFYGCDVSFVGCWSTGKELMIASLIEALGCLKFTIWGPGWDHAGDAVRSRWMHRGAYGDELVAIYCSSKINLGLLTSKHADSIQGDEVTVRTWQIPAAGGFLLHERTVELGEYFVLGQEVAAFEGVADLARNVEYFLENESERQRIAAAGYARCIASKYTYAPAARAICQYHENHSGGRMT
jgi:glycosyltransferase involved in cell wall biosynthesis